MTKDGFCKLNKCEEVKDFVLSSRPLSTKDSDEAKYELAESIVSLLVDFRTKLPPRSVVYANALTSIICSLNTYISFEKDNVGGVWKGYDYLCMAYTQYSQLEYFTRPKSEKRDSNIKLDLNAFLLEISNLWRILLSQYNDFSTKH